MFVHTNLSLFRERDTLTDLPGILQSVIGEETVGVEEGDESGENDGTHGAFRDPVDEE